MSPTIQLLQQTERDLRGQGGVPGVQIMENEFECLADRGGQDLAVAEEFVKNIVPS